MSDNYEQARVKAYAQGHDGTHGSATGMTRDLWPMSGWAGNCRCGCGGRATHAGGAGGLALTSGCELSMRRWVRDGFQPQQRIEPLTAQCPRCGATLGVKCRTLTTGWPVRFPHVGRYDAARGTTS